MKQSSPDLLPIPNRVYFRIGEVSQLVGVEPHVLRYWETEFSLIRPFRGKSKQRLYRRQDVENLYRIKQLLHDQGYTISGAKKCLKNLECAPQLEQLDPKMVEAAANSVDTAPLLAWIKQELLDIQKHLTVTKNHDW